MPAPLLETKLYVPRARPGLVARPRLSERLDRGAASTLTLVSAPAGFGKTTLLAEWLARDRRRAVGRAGCRSTAATTIPCRSGPMCRRAAGRWHPTSAPAPLAAPGRLATAADRVGAHHPAQRPRRRPDATSCWCSTTTTSSSRATSRTAMAFLLDHLPAAPAPGDRQPGRPPVPARPAARPRRAGRGPRGRPALHARRGGGVPQRRGWACELTAGDVAALEGRTEGWIAALQLAALSMQGRDDVAGFIAGFAGDDRYIVDYLVEEVLQRQPDPVRTFLLQTSILARLSGPLCDAVTGQDGGKAMLEALDRRNLFLVPLDDRRRWYRYHHLFARRAAGAPARRAARPGAGPAPAGERLVRRRTANRTPRSSTRWPPGTSSGRRTWWSWPLPALQRDRQEATLRAGSRGCPTSSSATGRCSASASSGR